MGADNTFGETNFNPDPESDFFKKLKESLGLAGFEEVQEKSHFAPDPEFVNLANALKTEPDPDEKKYTHTISIDLGTVLDQFRSEVYPLMWALNKVFECHPVKYKIVGSSTISGSYKLEPIEPPEALRLREQIDIIWRRKYLPRLKQK